MRRKNPANGSKKRGTGLRGFGDVSRVVIVFPDDMFRNVRARAIAKKTSFAEQARLLIEWGLEADHAL